MGRFIAVRESDFQELLKIREKTKVNNMYEVVSILVEIYQIQSHLKTSDVPVSGTVIPQEVETN